MVNRAVALPLTVLLLAGCRASPQAGSDCLPAPPGPASPPPEGSAFRDATTPDGAWLRHVEGIPVACVGGGPARMGAQLAALIGDSLGSVRESFDRSPEARAARLLGPAARAIGGQLPPPFLEEMRALCDATGGDLGQATFWAGLPDAMHLVFCSSFLVRDARPGPLHGRNLDYRAMGVLDRFGLVVVYRPEGRIPVAAVTWPGTFGVYSGMNGAGLTAAVHLAYEPAERDVQGEPMAGIAREILETCRSLDETEAALALRHPATPFLLAMAERSGASAIFEISPGRVSRRDAVHGACAATNHFRTPGRAASPEASRCRRYPVFERRLAEGAPHDVAGMTALLQEVHQGAETVQSMIFSPRTLEAWIAFGEPPVTRHAYRRLDLGSWLR